MPWIWFAIVQLICLAATIIGWLVLIPPCVLHAWEPGGKSIKDGRPIDQWKWKWLRPAFNNPEDGVSGRYAIIATGPYLPAEDARLRAYRWSALRNSCDNLKYVFAWSKGPLVTRTYSFRGVEHVAKFGWQVENGVPVPVLSLW